MPEVVSSVISQKGNPMSGEPSQPPAVSIVIPCLNEEICIGEFVDWCHQGLAAAQVTGEILIMDSSTDNSPEIAAAAGARKKTRQQRQNEKK